MKGYYRVVVSYRCPGDPTKSTISPGIDAYTPKYAEEEAKALVPRNATEVVVESVTHLGAIHNREAEAA